LKIVNVISLAMATIALLTMPGATSAEAKANWTATVSVAEDGTHTLGNPDAKVKLSEYVSYTCPHCANFEKAADAPLRLAYVMPGTVSVRVVHLIRDPVDLTIAVLANCGDTKGFFARHHAFLTTQGKWLTKATKMTEAQKARWTSGELAARLKAVTSDLSFYSTMEQRGTSRTQVDRCLGDEALARKLLVQPEEAKRLGVPGTPSFALDGVLADSIYDWPTLDAALKSRL